MKQGKIDKMKNEILDSTNINDQYHGNDITKKEHSLGDYIDKRFSILTGFRI